MLNNYQSFTDANTLEIDAGFAMNLQCIDFVGDIIVLPQAETTIVLIADDRLANGIVSPLFFVIVRSHADIE